MFIAIDNLPAKRESPSIATPPPAIKPKMIAITLAHPLPSITQELEDVTQICVIARSSCPELPGSARFQLASSS